MASDNYVHSHGYNYLYSGTTRDYGFKEDAGLNRPGFRGGSSDWVSGGLARL